MAAVIKKKHTNEILDYPNAVRIKEEGNQYKLYDENGFLISVVQADDVEELQTSTPAT